MSETLLLPPELAARWRIKVSRVHEMIRTGELRAFNVARVGSSRPRWRIPADAVAEWEASRTAVPAAPRVRRARRKRRDPGWVEYF